MPSISTSNRHGYCVRFSPFNADMLIVASSQYYGQCGAGTLYLLEVTDDELLEIGNAQWSDGLFDAVWANDYQELVASASGDGSIQLWNVRSLQTGLPFACFPAHGAEIYSIDWGKASSGNKLLSSSWDRTVKLWDAATCKLLSSFSAHTDVVFDARLSNFLPTVFSSVAADGSLVIWDAASPKPVARRPVHDGEALTCAWNKFNSNVLATGGSEGLIRGWDLRNMSQSVFELFGCEYAVRRVQFSPFDESALVSAAYDFSTRIWDCRRSAEPQETIVHHSEFVYGVDWSPHRPNQIADCGWDSLVHVFLKTS